MDYEELVAKANTTDFCTTANDLNNLGKSNGFGYGKEQKAPGKDLANTLYKAGAISNQTKKEIIKGEDTRNDIQHEHTKKLVSQTQKDNFEQAAKEATEKITNGFVAEF